MAGHGDQEIPTVGVTFHFGAKIRTRITQTRGDFGKQFSAFVELYGALEMPPNIKSWTGLSVEESNRMTEDRGKWRKYVHGVANPRIEDG